MIKLDKNIYDDIKEEYSSLLIPRIKNNYIEFKKKNPTNYMNNSFDFKDIFESKGFIDDNKIKMLLISRLDMMDISIINYIKTCIFVYWIKNNVYQVKKDITNFFNEIDSKLAVKRFFESFKNPIIESYMDSKDEYDTMSSLKKLCNNIDKDLQELNSLIKEFIDYDYLYGFEMRDKVIISSKIDICPYCGRQFITRFGDRSSADLDHFYPKKYLPLLSLSLYNFIPSCQICNSRFKNQKIKKILYPFNDSYENNARFYYQYITPITDIHPKVEIKIENISKDRHFETDEDINLFHIEEVYQSHNTFISNLLYKKHIYDNLTFKDGIKKLIPHNLSDEELNVLIYGYSLDIKKDEKRLLGKLVNDIYDFSNNKL